MTKIKGALIGCGFFAVNQMHGWQDLVDIEIVAICDRDPERLRIVGDQFGVAPGYELTLSWRDVELYSEGEFVFDTGDLGDHFFYSWSQLGYSPLEWLSLGLASQRTRAYETELDVQRGVFVGLAYRRLSLTAYVFNLGWETPTVVAALAATF